MAETRKEKEGDENSIYIIDVNFMFGWAIFHLRLRKIRQKIDQHADCEKVDKLTNEIDFLSNMRIHAEEVLSSDSCAEKCYNSFLRSSNRGFMTLVSVNTLTL